MEGLKNLMEDNVEQTINKLLPSMPNICSCNDCKLDMATYALNRLKPKYARTSRGVIMHRFDTLSTQVDAEYWQSWFLLSRSSVLIRIIRRLMHLLLRAAFRRLPAVLFRNDVGTSACIVLNARH